MIKRMDEAMFFFKKFTSSFPKSSYACGWGRKLNQYHLFYNKFLVGERADAWILQKL